VLHLLSSFVIYFRLLHKSIISLFSKDFHIVFNWIREYQYFVILYVSVLRKLCPVGKYYLFYCCDKFLLICTNLMTKKNDNYSAFDNTVIPRTERTLLFYWHNDIFYRLNDEITIVKKNVMMKEIQIWQR
jgi:hypothetical protein